MKDGKRAKEEKIYLELGCGAQDVPHALSQTIPERLGHSLLERMAVQTQ